MKIYIYIFIAISIYFYIFKNNIYIILPIHHFYFWSSIGTILFICYLFTFHKYHVYKFLYNIKKINDKPYYHL